MYVIIYDFGTSSVKTCLFEISSDIRLIASESAGYGLYISGDGGAEQDTEEWWAALCSTTRALFCRSDVKPGQIEGMAFCAQMQSTVLVDAQGNDQTPITDYHVVTADTTMLYDGWNVVTEDSPGPELLSRAFW